MYPQNSRKKCYLYVLNSLADWEIGFITAELKSRRFIQKKDNTDLIMIGDSIEPIITMGGIEITPDKSIDEIIFNEGDALILPGSDEWMNIETKPIIKKVMELLNSKIIVAAICGATVALARMGILDNRKHTSNDLGFLKWSCPDYQGSSFYINKPVVEGRNLITASGLAPLDFSYEIFKKLGIMKSDVLNAWYQLYQTKESKYFHQLTEAL